MRKDELKEYLDFKYKQYNTANFIESDPIQIPHSYQLKEDIEIIAFIVASIAWGNRKMIIKSGQRIAEIMGDSPYDFIQNYQPQKLKFVHRTFNSIDLDFFFRALQNIYQNGGLESAFQLHPEIKGTAGRIVHFREEFTSIPHEYRSQKHISNPAKNSAAKRINMFLRWMVRTEGNVDFGLWKSIPTSELYMPLDVHTGNISRKLGLLTRKQNDWKALEELMSTLREFDPNDPVKYDYALFGIGVFE